MNAAAAERAQERRELTEGAHALQVALGTEQADTLLALLDELSHWNRTYNLTALRTRAAMLHGHLLDSLSASPDLRGVRIADVGTGAGFPGLPLAVVTPQCAFTLIDSVGKKIRFVTHACRTLRVANVTALQARVQSLRPQVPFDTVIARAYAQLPQLLESVRGLCGPATRVVAMKGRDPLPELSAMPHGWRLEGSRVVRIPGLPGERHILRLVPDAPAARLAGS